ncbi:O-antigen ligase family protein [Brevibacillus humidisoli]|uniref:O-antigen ligase family protein n=1 Tax=Brevibacillus humidisoli TaxID=2895522 RepID=UPI001E33969C|nr:O-antigen ligase family protein [Brevibacillus humidisoli]UFJ42500.1 O-antigen ligase family protein [Brevibacillus humidisoli]
MLAREKAYTIRQQSVQAYLLPQQRETQRLEILLNAFVICLPIQLETGIDLRFAPSDLFLAIFLLLGLRKLVFRATVFSLWHFLLPAIFGLATFLSVIYNGNLTRYVLLNKDIGLLVLFATYVALTSVIDSEAKWVRLLRLFVINVSIHNMLAIAVYLSGIELPGINELGVRISGMLHDPNAFGGLLVAAFAIHIVTYCQNRPLIAGRWGLFTLFTLPIGILLTFSRSAWIGLVIVLLMLIGYRLYYALHPTVALAFTFAAILVIRGTAFISEMMVLASRPEQILVRLEILQDALTMFQQYPLFGAGLGSYLQVYGIIIHNTPTWFLTEFGLVGFVVFTGFLLWFLRRGIDAYRSSDQAGRPLLYGLIMAHLSMIGLSLGIEALYQRHWWLIMAGLATVAAVKAPLDSRVRESGIILQFDKGEERT